jgi:signal transduction histidine kinase
MQLTAQDDVEMIILTLNDITDRAIVEQQIRVLATELTRAEQAERQRISQILHDDLQQRLFALKMQSSLLNESYRKGDVQDAQSNFDQLLVLLNESILITRNLSIDLSPAVLQGEGLADALVWLAAQMKEQYDLQVTIHTHNISTRFEDTMRVLLFRAIREALFNVVKHAKTSQAEISFAQTGDEVLIAIHDNGKGFDGDGLFEDSHATGGLMNIRHRLQLMGCTIDVVSHPGDGTTVTIRVPARQVLS